MRKGEAQGLRGEAPEIMEFLDVPLAFDQLVIKDRNRCSECINGGDGVHMSVRDDDFQIA